MADRYRGEFGRMADALERPGRTRRDNPLVEWYQGYGLRGMRARVPRVTGGTYRGNKWDALKPAYYRGAQTVSLRTRGALTPAQLKAQGQIVAGIGGSVTPSEMKRIGRRRRRVSGGTPVPAWGGVRKLKGRGNVKGKKRASGKRYTKASGLLRDTDNMFRDFFRADPVFRNGNRTIVRTATVQYAAKQDSMRPFAWGSEIERVELAELDKAIDNFVNRMWGRG